MQPVCLAPEPPAGQPWRSRAQPAGAATAPVPGAPDVDPALLVRVALLDLYAAHRAPGEDYPQCFARLGAPGYAALLAEVLAVPGPARLAQAPLPR
jgi:hypothetical protein